MWFTGGKIKLYAWVFTSIIIFKCYYIELKYYYYYENLHINFMVKAQALPILLYQIFHLLGYPSTGEEILWSKIRYSL